MENKTKVLIFGHSFVRRLREHLERNHGDEHYLDLEKSNTIATLYGVGGMTVGSAEKHLHVMGII